MWYPAVIPEPAAEPVALATAKAHCRIDSSAEDSLVTLYVAAARAHLERQCDVLFAARSGVALYCDGFDDFARIDVGPVTAISSISYVDTTGATQTLSASVYELRAFGYEAQIVLKYGQSWPSVQPGSRVTVTATVGFATILPDLVPPILLLVGHQYEHREAVNIGNISNELPFAVQHFIANHRRGV